MKNQRRYPALSGDKNESDYYAPEKIAKLLFNRSFYVALALLVQLGWLFILVWQLAAYSKYISFGITVVSILSVLWIVNKKINPSYKLTPCSLWRCRFSDCFYTFFSENQE